MQVINLYGGPGTGKSTISAGLFFLFKTAYKETELVNEYAKYLVWSERVKMFQEQGYVFAKQNHKLEILRDKVDYAITDSPLPLSIIYGNDLGYYSSFEDYVIEKFDSYDNINVFLNRKKQYRPNGRNQTEEEAIQKDQEIKVLMDDLELEYITIDADVYAPWNIFKEITGEDHHTKLEGMR